MTILRKSVSLNPGESKPVAFQFIPSEAKTYGVLVDGLAGSFVASSPPPEVGWILPTGHIDPEGKWANEWRAYDDDLGTFASTYGLHYYGEPLELTLDPPVNCNMVRIYATSWVRPSYRNPNISIDVHYDGAWHNIWSGSITKQAWVEIPIPAGIKLVDKARVKWNEDVSIYLHEFNFWSEG